MPAESIKVCAPELLASAAMSARVLDLAAAPASRGTPPPSGGVSAADVAGGAVAAGIGALEQGFAESHAMSGQAIESTTRAGIARLQSQDEANAETLRRIAPGW